MSIILLLCVFIKRPPGWGWGHIQLRPWVVKVIAVAPSLSCQNPSAAMYILVSNRLQPGGCWVAILAQNVQQGLLAVPQRVRTRIVKKKTLAAPPSPQFRGQEHKAKFCLSQKYENVLLSEIFFCRCPEGADRVGGQYASEEDCSHGPRNVG